MKCNTITLSSLVLFLAGCATAKAIIGPDGAENQLISCDDVERCYKKANEVCHGPYKIVNTITAEDTVSLLVKCGGG